MTACSYDFSAGQGTDSSSSTDDGTATITSSENATENSTETTGTGDPDTGSISDSASGTTDTTTEVESQTDSATVDTTTEVETQSQSATETTTDTETGALTCEDFIALSPVSCGASQAFADHSYRFCSTGASPHLSWHQADRYCLCFYGGHLVTIDSAPEQSFLAAALGGDRTWIGATDEAAEGTWLWVDGSSALGGDYDNWSSNEPNNSGATEDCAMMMSTWYDVDCARTDIPAFVCEHLAAPEEVIVDNTDPGFTASGSWVPSSSPSGFWGSNYFYRNTSKTAEDPGAWYASLANSNYDVYARWTSASNRPTVANYRIWFDGGDTVVPVNQTLNGGSWQKLGTWPMVSTYGKRVELSNLFDGPAKMVIADAVRFVPVP